MTERHGLTLPAPGQTLVSERGREWEVLRVWQTVEHHRLKFGVVARLRSDRPQVRTIRLDIPGRWRLRLSNRQQGEWHVCPVCGARYGGVSTCAYDGATLIPLAIEPGISKDSSGDG